MEIEVIVTDEGYVEGVLIDGNEKDFNCISLDKYLDNAKKMRLNKKTNKR